MPNEISTNLKIILKWKNYSDNISDLDLSVFLLDKNYKVINESYVVYYNQKSACNGAAIYNGDSKGETRDNSERVSIDLSKLSEEIENIAVCASAVSDTSFKEFERPIVKIYETNDNLSDKYIQGCTLCEAPDESGIIVSLLKKGNNGKWVLNRNSKVIHGGLKGICECFGAVSLDLVKKAVEPEEESIVQEANEKFFDSTDNKSTENTDNIKESDKFTESTDDIKEFDKSTKSTDSIKESDKSTESKAYTANNFSNENSSNANDNSEELVKKNKWVSFILCLLLGYFGAHLFYEGDAALGVIYIIITCVLSLSEILLTIWLVFILLNAAYIASKKTPYYVKKGGLSRKFLDSLSRK